MADTEARIAILGEVRDIVEAMGFNPFRPATFTPIDLVIMVVTTVVVIFGLVWAIGGW